MLLPSRTKRSFVAMTVWFQDAPVQLPKGKSVTTFTLSSIMRTPSIIVAFVALCLGVTTGSSMTDKKEEQATPIDVATCRIDGPKSACGLPSEVVIDMSKRKVSRTEADWRKRLTSLQYRVSREQSTEPPFRNEFWDNHADGVYVCVGCDTPLFDSKTKFESGTGWPSYWQPIEHAFVGELTDSSHFMVRTEVHCTVCGGHLGHLFKDGPRPTGQRYCINSASLRFLPRKEYDAWVDARSVKAKP